jgi:hypothetical protein
MTAASRQSRCTSRAESWQRHLRVLLGHGGVSRQQRPGSMTLPGFPCASQRQPSLTATIAEPHQCCFLCSKSGCLRNRWSRPKPRGLAQRLPRERSSGCRADRRGRDPTRKQACIAFEVFHGLSDGSSADSICYNTRSICYHLLPGPYAVGDSIS